MLCKRHPQTQTIILKQNPKVILGLRNKFPGYRIKKNSLGKDNELKNLELMDAKIIFIDSEACLKLL